MDPRIVPPKNRQPGWCIVTEGDRESGAAEVMESTTAETGRQLVFEDRVVIESDRDDLWRQIKDPEFLAKCIPGSNDITRQSDTRYSLDITRAVSRLTLSIDGTVEIVEMDEPNWLVIKGDAYDSRTHSTFTGTAALQMSQSTDEAVELAYRANLSIEGGTAVLTPGLLRPIVKSDVKQYFENLERHFHDRQGDNRDASDMRGVHRAHQSEV